MPKKVTKECVNCGTIRYPIKARNLCKRCYWLILKLEKVRKWDYSKPETLKGYPRDRTFQGQGRFNALKRGTIHSIENRLAYLKIKEMNLSGQLTGYNLEIQFERINEIAGGLRKKLFHSWAGIFDDNFNRDQLRIIYQGLLEIEENRRQESVITSEFLDSDFEADD